MSAYSGEFEAVIGLEVHCQLSTDTKIFCGCRARPEVGRSVADEVSNSYTCPVCAGHPGALPVLNRKAVAYAIKAGLATHCRIESESVFERKNYFYPDLPKGYQITQSARPICIGGHLDITLGHGAEPKRIRIHHIHLEEDAGKNVHHSGYSLVNLNRAGVPLIEIVSEPDMRSAPEAGAYLRGLHAVVTYLGITDGNMQEGNFRCDANVSVRPRGQEKFGTRVEIKNVNSFRFVEKAIDYEIARQIETVKAGGKVVQETRTFDSSRGVTLSMRSKEEAMDYRYFPDPDLLPLRVRGDWVERLRGILPELPEQRKARYMKELGLGADDAAAITGSRAMAEFFEAVIEELRKVGAPLQGGAKGTANWLTGEITRLLNDEGIELAQCRVTPRHLAELVQLGLKQVVSSTGAKQVLATVWKTGEGVETVVDREGLRQVSDTSALEPAVDEVLAEFPAQLAELKGGKDKVMGFFVGQVMKRTGGKANPSLVQELIRRKL